MSQNGTVGAHPAEVMPLTFPNGTEVVDFFDYFKHSRIKLVEGRLQSCWTALCLRIRRLNRIFRRK